MCTTDLRVGRCKLVPISVLQKMALLTALSVCATNLQAQNSSPPALINAHAEDFTVSKITLLDTDAGRPAFSRDGKLLAYVKSVINPKDNTLHPTRLIVVSLLTGERRRAFDLSEPIWGTAWSPDGSRIVVQDEKSNGFILDVAKGSVISLGALPAVPWNNEIIWPDPRNLYFINTISPAGSSQFDLETFVSKRLGDENTVQNMAVELRKTPIDHPSVELRTMYVKCTGCVNADSAIVASNRDGSYIRVLIPKLERAGYTSVATFSPPATYGAIMNDRQLRLITLGTRPRPRLGVSATVMPLPDAIQESDLAKWGIHFTLVATIGCVSIVVNKGFSIFAFAFDSFGLFSLAM